MIKHVLDLFHSWLELCQPIYEAKAGGRSSRVATHPWLDVIDVVIDLIDALIPRLQLDAALRVVKTSLDVLIQHVLQVKCCCVPMLLHRELSLDVCKSAEFPTLRPSHTVVLCMELLQASPLQLHTSTEIVS